MKKILIGFIIGVFIAIGVPVYAWQLLDISSQTDLTVTSPITLTDDDVGFDFTTDNNWTGLNTWTDARPAMLNASTTNIDNLTVFIDATIGRNATVTSHFAANGIFFVKDGNVGIGTASPATTLEVNGHASTTQLTVGGDGLVVNGSALFQNAIDSTTGFQILDADGGTPILNVNTTNERFEIGGTGTTQTFQVNSVDGNIALFRRIASGSAQIRVSADNSTVSFLDLQTFTGATRSGIRHVDGTGISNTGFLDFDIVPGTTANDAQFRIFRTTNAQNVNTRYRIFAGNGTSETYIDFKTQSGTSVINQNGEDIDFRIEGDTDINLFYVDAGNDRIGIGIASPQTTLEVNGTASTTQLIVGGGGIATTGLVTINAGSAHIATGNSGMGIGTTGDWPASITLGGANNFDNVTIGGTGQPGKLIVKGNLEVDGNATTSGQLVVGTVDPTINLSAGDIFIEGRVIPDNDCGVTSGMITAVKAANVDEDNAGLEWSYGALNQAGWGSAQCDSGIVTALSIYCQGGVFTSTIQVAKDGVGQGVGCQVTSASGADNSALTTGCTIAFNALDTIGFITTAHTTTGANSCVSTLWIRYD